MGQADCEIDEVLESGSGLDNAGKAHDTAGQQQGGMSMIIMMAALFGVMYFVMIRPQKKKQKEEQNMRDSIQVGDEITTIGGIMGRVVTVKEDSLIIGNPSIEEYG